MKVMGNLRRWFGIFILVIFTAMAGSVICLAMAQASDCGGNMQPAAMCPFMSVSIPAVANGISGVKVLNLVILLVVAVGTALGFFLIDRSKKLFISAYERKREISIGTHANIVLNLISDGILHSRIFSF